MVQPDLGTAMMVLMGGGALPVRGRRVRIWMFLAAGVSADGLPADRLDV
jgi:rod shape determining protein RodA